MIARRFASLAATGLLVTLTVGVLAPHVHAAGHDIAIRDAGFDPPNLTVFVGEPVSWTNGSKGIQTVTSDDRTLDSGDIGPGNAYGHVFEAAGVFAYHSESHLELKGSITVLAAPATPVPSGLPQPTPPPGTLPPNFSPFPSQEVSPEPTATATATSTALSTPAPVSGPDDGDSNTGPIAAILVILAIGAALLLARFRGR